MEKKENPALAARGLIKQAFKKVVVIINNITSCKKIKPEPLQKQLEGLNIILFSKRMKSRRNGQKCPKTLNDAMCIIASQDEDISVLLGIVEGLIGRRP